MMTVFLGEFSHPPFISFFPSTHFALVFLKCTIAWIDIQAARSVVLIPMLRLPLFILMATTAVKIVLTHFACFPFFLFEASPLVTLSPSFAPICNKIDI